MFFTRRRIAWLAALIAVLQGISHLTTRPIDITKPTILLNDESYNLSPILSPIVSGLPLNILSNLLTKSFIGLTIRRYLIQDNGLYKIRELAYQLGDIPPLHHPMNRLSKSAREAYDSKAADPDIPNNDLDSIIPFPIAKSFLNSETSDVIKFHELYKTGAITPTIVANNLLQEIARLNPIYRMFAADANVDDILLQASQSSARFKSGTQLSIFDGVPVAFKDMIKIKGYLMTDGSAYNAKVSKISKSDDFIVSRFRELGALILPPSSMTEGGVTPIGFSVHPQGPYNPHNSSHYSGGSSGGSAVAVSLGFSLVAIGYDGGGSIRTPASWSGVMGLATGFGRIPMGSHMFSTNIKTGCFALKSNDAALAYAVMARQDKSKEHTFYDEMYDGESTPVASLGEFFNSNVENISGITLGVYKDWVDDCTPSVRAAFQETLDGLIARGAVVKEIVIPHLGIGRLAHAMKISSEFGLAWDGAYNHPLHGDLLEANTRVTVGVGHSVTAVEALAVDKFRMYMFNRINGIFDEGVDAIITPTAPLSAPFINIDKKYGESNNVLTGELTKFIYLVNFLGLPGISVPMGLDETNNQMPLGFQFMGAQWNDSLMLRLGKVVEDIRGNLVPKDRVDVLKQ